MKALIWGLFAVLLLGWSGMAWVSAELVGWLGSAVGALPAGQAAQTLGDWPVPAWVALWVSPEVIQGLQAAWLEIAGWLGALLPSAEGVSGVVIAVVWIGWGLGALTLLTVAGLAHWLVGRLAPQSPRPST